MRWESLALPSFNVNVVVCLSRHVGLYPPLPACNEYLVVVVFVRGVE